MSALTIDLPDPLRSRLESRASENAFPSVEAYVQALLAADAAPGPRATDEQVEALLRARVDGPFVEADDADFRQMRAKLAQRPGDGSDAGPLPEPGT